jgi:anaerobic selenocysteine-containing dehydrogenase
VPVTFEFWKRTADALGRSDVVSWPTLEALYDWRLEKVGIGFEEFAETYEVYAFRSGFKKYEKVGFATPSGKVELKSSVLESLGFDPLPYYRPDPPPDPDYPLMMFTGVREDEYFQTGGRHIPELRARKPEPVLFVSPATAAQARVVEGEWVAVESPTGRIEIKVGIRDSMPDGLVRIPHGWWKPEMEHGLKQQLSGALRFADALLCPDDEDYLDREQGIPHLKGLPCRIGKLGGICPSG